MTLKHLISPPLEAGTSILDAHHLPSYLIPALEYASQRLARKKSHVTLVAVQRDYQIPACSNSNSNSNTDTPAATLPTPPQSPISPDGVPRPLGFGALGSLVRPATHHNTARPDKPHTKAPKRSRTMTMSTKSSFASLFDAALGSSRLKWPLTPSSLSFFSTSPKTPVTPATPRTPAPCTVTPSSSTKGSARGPLENQNHRLHLVHTTPLTFSAERLVASALYSASRKFRLNQPLTANRPTAHSIPPDVVHCSILQNEPLFSSDGLTVLSLDHLYTFKSALSRYAKSISEPGSDFRLEDAVDELRRCVLSSTGKRQGLFKSVLVAQFEWLGPLDEAALLHVTSIYCRAYGGSARDKGIEDDLTKPPYPSTEEPPGVSAGDDQSHLPQAQTSDDTFFPNVAVLDILDKHDNSNKNNNTTSTLLGDQNAQGEGQNKEVQADKLLAPVINMSAGESEPKQRRTLKFPLLRDLPKAGLPKAGLPKLKLQTSFPKPLPPPATMPKPTPTTVLYLESDTYVSAAPLSPSRTDQAKRDNPIEIDVDQYHHHHHHHHLTDLEEVYPTIQPPPSAITASYDALWPGNSIDEVLGDRQQGGVAFPGRHRKRSSLCLSPQPQLQRVGPTTPNGYDDISPITRDEWGFLMVGDRFKTKTAAVETW